MKFWLSSAMPHTYFSVRYALQIASCESGKKMFIDLKRLSAFCEKVFCPQPFSMKAAPKVQWEQTARENFLISQMCFCHIYEKLFVLIFKRLF